MKKQKVYLAGIGTGTYQGMTIEVSGLLGFCDIYFGAKRMLAIVPENGKKKMELYQAEKIYDCLKKEKDWKCACVLLSGDVGFYSGAKKLLQVLKEYEVLLFPGISCVSSFCAKLQIPWEDVSLLSLHGRDFNVIGKILCSRYTFVLMDGEKGVKKLCEKLLYYNLTSVTLHVGERLGYENEKIRHGTAEEILSYSMDDLIVVIAENPQPEEAVTEIKDESFIRGKVPMTKCEIRSLAIQKLGLSGTSVLYDIGAGTGSVSVQAARMYSDCKVFAVERNEDARDLIEKNKRKFAADNLEIVSGTAPEALAKLPNPTHAFIGGSGGHMEEVLKAVWEKNTNTVIVLTVVTLETLASLTEMLKNFDLLEEEILQISITKTTRAGNYHLLTGQNPVFMIKLVLA